MNPPRTLVSETQPFTFFLEEDRPAVAPQDGSLPSPFLPLGPCPVFKGLVGKDTGAGEGRVKGKVSCVQEDQGGCYPLPISGPPLCDKLLTAARRLSLFLPISPFSLFLRPGWDFGNSGRVPWRKDVIMNC